MNEHIVIVDEKGAVPVGAVRVEKPLFLTYLFVCCFGLFLVLLGWWL